LLFSLQAQLAELDNIDNYYSSLPESELTITNPQVGTACVTRFTDQRFYRSKITAINGNMASVLFVDNGKSEEIPLSQLRQIEPRFVVCPKLVRATSLWNFFLSIFNVMAVLGVGVSFEGGEAD